MSTAKFNIYNMGIGHDARRDSMVRKGYGDLLDIHHSGRKETTIDTASMYKKAADQGAILGAGVGGVAGGIGGAEIAEAMSGSATAKLMGALVGAGLGGVGGYYAGGALDKVDKDNLTTIDKYRSPVYTIGGGALGALTGYGMSKYLMGSKNKTHHVISALLGAGVGAGAGHLVSGSEEYNEAVKDGLVYADRLGVKDKNKFAKLYAKHRDKAKINPWYNMFVPDSGRSLGSNIFERRDTDAVSAALEEYNTGNENPTEISYLKSGAIALGSGLLARSARNKTREALTPGVSEIEKGFKALRRPSSLFTNKLYKDVPREEILKRINDAAKSTSISDIDLRYIVGTDEFKNVREFAKKYPDIMKQVMGMHRRWKHWKTLGVTGVDAFKNAPIKETWRAAKSTGATATKQLYHLLRAIL